MRKILYFNLSLHDYKNKVTAQVSAMNNLGFSVYVVTISNENLELYLYDPKNNLRLIFEKKLEGGFKSVNRYLIELNSQMNFEYLYIRRPGIKIIKIRKMISLFSKDTKVIYEIPTYPFDKDKNILKKSVRLVERLYFKLFINRYIDVIPVMLQKKVKLSPKMYITNNGVSKENIKKIKNMSIEKRINEFNMISIAHLNYWHGLDRLIKSMENYKGDTKIKLFVVSEETEEVNRIKKYLKNNQININISFLGRKNIEEINELTDKCHIGIGSLGYHRRGATLDTSIKNKEYVAQGLPFISSIVDMAFPLNFQFRYKVDENDSEFDLTSVINWYESLKSNNPNFKKDLIDFAEENLTLDIEIKNILSRCDEYFGGVN